MRPFSSFVLAVSVLVSASASAQVVRITAAQFLPSAGKITFSEKPVGTANPPYAPADYGGVAGASPNVSFKGFFTGQSLGTATPPCPTGATLTGCVLGSPSAPLSLAAASPNTSIVSDGANPTSPVLSGSPTFNGPIAILFDIDLAAVGLSGGFFDAAASTAITAFRRDGTSLGSVSNIGTGIEFLGLKTADGSNQIAGLLFSLVGPEPAGFAIDNLQFGTGAQIVGTPAVTLLAVPTLSELSLIALGLILALGAAAQLRKRAA